MNTYKFLIVGLGNPDRKYRGNRHNVGCMALEAFAAKNRGELTPTSGIYYSGELRYAGKNILLCFPTTYMNGSGEAVKKIANKFGIAPKDIIVLVDEYNFPVGKIHLKSSGSDGGHNGIMNIIDELGTRDFNRLRLGIDRNFGMGELVDYVLSDFTAAEQEPLQLMLSKAVDALECIIKNGVQRAMSMINSGELWKPKEEKTKDTDSEE